MYSSVSVYFFFSSFFILHLIYTSCLSTFFFLFFLLSLVISFIQFTYIPCFCYLLWSCLLMLTQSFMWFFSFIAYIISYCPISLCLPSCSFSWCTFLACIMSYGCISCLPSLSFSWCTFLALSLLLVYYMSILSWEKLYFFVLLKMSPFP